MIQLKCKEECCGCSACSQACGFGAIEMRPDEEGFLYPAVDQSKCAKCGLCEKVCPYTEDRRTDSVVSAAYACYNKDDTIRSVSTSGGIFSAIAFYMIDVFRAVVCGARFNERFEVVHSFAETKEEIAAFRGSKYSQSNLRDSYIKIRKYLRDGRYVLFTGTPCQVEGLLAFLGKKEERLVTMDFVCHGVASPMVWSKYLDRFKDRETIREIVFKDKRNGWKQWHTKIRFDDHEIFQRGYLNPFMSRYLEHLFLRPSCYVCRFKGLKHNSDFTISDCWGAGEEDAQMNDNNGLSALLLQSPFGLQTFNQIKSSLVYKKYDCTDLMKGNYTAIRSVPINPKREKFFSEIKNRSFEKAFRKYCVPKLISMATISRVADWIKDKKAGIK